MSLDLFGRVRATMLGAAIAFYAVFSLAPIAVIAVAVAGLILEDALLRAQIAAYVERELGPEPARLVAEMMEGAAEPGTGGLIATITGLVVLLYAATRLFAQLQKALNQVWEVRAEKAALRRSLMHTLEKRALSFLLVLGMGAFLLASVVVSTAASAAGEEIGRWVALPAWVMRGAETTAVGLVLAAAFTVLFKILPDAQVEWRPALYGGLLAAALFSVGRVALGVYFGRAAVASEYGAAGALMVLILWIYYSSLVLFFGAVFTRAYTENERARPLEVRAGWSFSLPPAWRKDRSGRGKDGRPRGEQGPRPQA